jgi:hypothetical protein
MPKDADSAFRSAEDPSAARRIACDPTSDNGNAFPRKVNDGGCCTVEALRQRSIFLARTLYLPAG